MAEDIKQEMNSTPGCIPSKWNRNTVADGDWLQKYTLAPLSSRDNFLADKISGAEFNLDEEIKARIAGDKYLSATIDSLSSDFYTFSGNVCVSAENLSAALKEEIRIRGEQDYNLSQQIIGEKSQRIEADNKLQKEIDKLEAATDVIMVYADYNEFTIGSAYLVEEDYLTDADVIKVLQDETSGSKQIYYQWYDPASAHEWSGWSAIGSLEPYYSIADMDRILADTVDNLSATVSSNYLSANTTAVQPGHNIKITNPVARKPYIKIETSSHVTFDGVSSTNLSATNASGTSAKFSGVSGTTVLGKTVSGTSGIFTSAKITTGNILTAYGTSAKFDDLSGIRLNGTNISEIIGSAQSGKFAYNVVNSAKFSAVGALTANISGGFGISAGQGVSFIPKDNGIVGISSEGTTYGAGTYISTANKNISVTGNLIGSAESGQYAYNVLQQSATITNGPGILFYNDDNKLGIKVDVRGVSNTITGIGTSALSAGDNYRQGKNIEITGTDIKDISLSSRIDVPDGVITSATNKLVEINPNHAIVSGFTTRSEYVDITPQNIHIYTYAQPAIESYLFSDGFSAIVQNPSTHQGSVTGSISWYELTQIPYNYMKVVPEARGSILSANRKITLVVTSTLPSVIQDPDTYYIV